MVRRKLNQRSRGVGPSGLIQTRSGVPNPSVRLRSASPIVAMFDSMVSPIAFQMTVNFFVQQQFADRKQGSEQ